MTSDYLIADPKYPDIVPANYTPYHINPELAKDSPNGILLVKLRKNQSLKLKCIARRGIGARLRRQDGHKHPLGLRSLGVRRSTLVRPTCRRSRVLKGLPRLAQDGARPSGAWRLRRPLPGLDSVVGGTLMRRPLRELCAWQGGIMPSGTRARQRSTSSNRTSVSTRR